MADKENATRRVSASPAVLSVADSGCGRPSNRPVPPPLPTELRFAAAAAQAGCGGCRWNRPAAAGCARGVGTNCGARGTAPTQLAARQVGFWGVRIGISRQPTGAVILSMRNECAALLIAPLSMHLVPAVQQACTPTSQPPERLGAAPPQVRKCIPMLPPSRVHAAKHPKHRSAVHA